MREIKFRAWDDENNKMIGPYEVGSELSMQWGSGDGQYTGLKDKTGVEIYEGDIVQGNHANGKIYICEIKYQYGKFIMWFPVNKDTSTGGFGFDYFDLKQKEVIGNIYENPELDIP